MARAGIKDASRKSCLAPVTFLPPKNEFPAKVYNGNRALLNSASVG
jgi:hypothetical protein